jgi:hypothetical protein
LKTIGLLEPAASGEYVVQNLGHPGMASGHGIRAYRRAYCRS